MYQKHQSIKIQLVNKTVLWRDSPQAPQQCPQVLETPLFIYSIPWIDVGLIRHHPSIHLILLCGHLSLCPSVLLSLCPSVPLSGPAGLVLVSHNNFNREKLQEVFTFYLLLAFCLHKFTLPLQQIH